MGLLIGIISFTCGSLFGVALMCMLQINRIHGNEGFGE